MLRLTLSLSETSTPNVNLQRPPAWRWYDWAMTEEPVDQPALAVLDALLEADASMTMAVLARRAGLTVPVAGDRVDRLVDVGCVIDRHPQHGVRLASTGIGCWSRYIESRHAGRTGRRTLVYRQTASTQDIARSLVEQAATVRDFDGYVVVADHQTSGRGRLGRVWLSRPGRQLLMSIVLARPDEPVDRLMLAGSLAIAEVVAKLTGLHPEVRWPNDIFVDGRKLAGTLVDTPLPGCALLGVGLNVSLDPAHLGPTLRRRVTSLTWLECFVDRLRVLDLLLDELDKALGEPDAALVRAWRGRAGLVQQRITVEADGRQLTGRVIDIDPSHGLVLEVEAGPVVTLPAATTSLVPAADV